MMAGLWKPIAVGTSNFCETSTEAGRDRWNSSINARNSAGKACISTGTASARNLRTWIVASATRARPAKAIAAQPRKMYHAHEAETVTTACESPAPAWPDERKFNKGRIAVASKVENHTAKLVRESLLGTSRNTDQTAAASSVPATMLYNRRSAAAIAIP
jgi:hypothetical protein